MGNKHHNGKTSEGKPKPERKQYGGDPDAERRSDRNWIGIVQGILAALSTIFLLLVTLFYEEHRTLSIWLMFVVVLGFAVALYLNLSSRTGIGRVRLYLPIACVLAALFGCVYWQSRERPYEVTFGTPLVAGDPVGRFFAMSPSPSGCALYPAHLVIPLRITNRQRTASLIEQYSLQVETSPGFWQKLRKLDERTESFFFIGNDIHAASQIDLTDDGMDFLLWKKALKPNEPIQGWALFQGTGPTLANKRLRITIVDDQDNDYEQEQPANGRPLDPKEAIQGNTLRPIPGTKDLSSCKIALLEPVR